MERQSTPAKLTGGAPQGNQNGFIHGHFSRAAIEERRRARAARDAARAQDKQATH